MSEESTHNELISDADTVESLQEKLLEKEEEIQELYLMIRLSAAIHVTDPFIPEYLGFSNGKIEVDGYDYDVYQKDGFTIMRNLFGETEQDKDKWIIKINSTNHQYPYLIGNMLEAIILFRTLGMNVEVE